MSSNMAIPAVNIGGNIVQPTPEGKIKVTTAKGKVKVLSQDQFEKQIKKNAENIKAGKDFEIKKDNQALKVGGLITAAAAIVAGVIYRKDLAKLFKKAGEQVSEAATKIADKVTGKNKGKTQVKDLYTGNSYWIKDGKDATRTVKNQTIAQMYSDEGIEAAKAARNTELAKMKKDATSAFKDYDADKVLEGLKAGKKPEELGLTHIDRPKAPEKLASNKELANVQYIQDARLNAIKKSGIKDEAEFEAIKLYAKPETKEIPAKLPDWAKDKETCQRYAYSVDQSIAKAEHEAVLKGAPKSNPTPKPNPSVDETPKAEAKTKTKKSKGKKGAPKTETTTEQKPATKAKGKKTETKPEVKPEPKAEDKK